MSNTIFDDKSNCVGCSACYSICPENSIEILIDEEGFCYPEVDINNCIECGKCIEICPINKINYYNKKSNVYACINKDINILKQSSSGGIFTLFAQYILKNNGIVFGAMFDEDFNIIHNYIDNFQDIYKLRGSKYAESDLRDSFKEVKKFLDKGKLILFSGSPCQVAGLKSYLINDYDNLIACDFICTGVPSPKIYKAYINYFSQKYNSKPIAINFRNKNKGWYNFSLEIEFENRKYEKSRFFDNFIIGHFNHLFLRPSCYNCKFKELNSGSDIKLGDFWGIENIHTSINSYNGVSLVLINSNKAEKLFNEVKNNIFYQISNLENVYKTNASYSTIVKENENRKMFFSDVKNCKNNENVIKILKKYTKINMVAKIKIIIILLKRKLYKYKRQL